MMPAAGLNVANMRVSNSGGLTVAKKRVATRKPHPNVSALPRFEGQWNSWPIGAEIGHLLVDKQTLCVSCFLLGAWP